MIRCLERAFAIWAISSQRSIIIIVSKIKICPGQFIHATRLPQQQLMLWQSKKTNGNSLFIDRRIDLNNGDDRSI